MRKTDIHCHVLPGIDDGSQSWQESLEMLKLAAAQGFEAAVATPHASERFSDRTPREIREMCGLLEERAKAVFGQTFRIYPGQEILYSEEAAERLLRGELLTINGSSYVLVEFVPNTPYSSILQGVERLRMSGFLPGVAHVERYGALRRDEGPEGLLEAGAILQMNYRSLAGRWYEENCVWCRKMLKEKKVQLLGTDMHNAGPRRPDTAHAEQWMKRHLDGSYIQELMYKNAQRILKNERLAAAQAC